MPHVRANNEVVEGDAVTLAAGTRTAGGAGPAEVVGLRHTARLTLAVTAASGTTPTMTVTVEHSADGTTWVAHTAFPAVTGVATHRRVLSGLDRFVRAAWTVGGTTPSFTFTVSGELV